MAAKHKRKNKISPKLTKVRAKRQPGPKRRKHLWELEMEKPPRGVDVLREVIRSKVSFYQPKIFHELYQEVVDDYGPVTDRTVYRNLSWLINEEGSVQRVLFEEDSCYLRTGTWKDAVECQTPVETDAYAA